MREIKFRGYDGMDWIYGTAVLFDKETDTWYMIEQNSPDDDWVMVGEIGQYTGQKDTNGKEIYEGDIVQFATERIDGMKIFTSEVKYEDAAFVISEGVDYFDTFLCGMTKKENMMEVIGNIHQPPFSIEGELT